MVSKKVVEIPKGSFIYGNGYVYVNIESAYDPKAKFTRTKRLCIGKNIDGKTMYASDNYGRLYGESLPEPKERADALAVGGALACAKAAEDSGLMDTLRDAFGEDGAKFILDLANFALTERTDAFQHFSAYGYHNARLSTVPASDSTIGRFLKESVTPSSTRRFLDGWRERNDDNCSVYICYDSTNVNCVASGVTLAEMGHAKDDPTKPQVNLEFVIRQKDGLPLVYRQYPGSIVDVVECSDMVELLRELGYTDIVAVCDRGYISGDNIHAFAEAGVGFLLLLRDCKLTEGLVERCGKKVRLRSDAYIPGHDLYGITVKHRLFGTGGPTCHFHIVWSQDLAEKGRKNVMAEVSAMEETLARMLRKGTPVTASRHREFSRFFEIRLHPRTRKIAEFVRNATAIDDAVDSTGFMVLASSNEITCAEAVEAYSKRDCVEKSFRALKSDTGMSALRGHTNAALEGRFFIFFVASILRSVLFERTRGLRKDDRKSFTFSAMVRELNKVEAVVDYKTGRYSRRYKLTAKQKSVLSCLGLDESHVDQFAKNL